MSDLSMEAKRSERGHVALLRLAGGGDWKGLLSRMGSFAVEQDLARPGIVDALLEREGSYPTGIGSAVGVAIPHTDQKYTRQAGLVVATLEKPVMFRPMGGGEADIPVEAVFLLLMKDAGKHLDLLGTIVGFIQERARIDALKSDKAVEILSASFDGFFA